MDPASVIALSSPVQRLLCFASMSYDEIMRKIKKEIVWIMKISAQACLRSSHLIRKWLIWGCLAVKIVKLFFMIVANSHVRKQPCDGNARAAPQSSQGEWTFLSSDESRKLNESAHITLASRLRETQQRKNKGVKCRRRFSPFLAGSFFFAHQVEQSELKIWELNYISLANAVLSSFCVCSAQHTKSVLKSDSYTFYLHS